MCRPTLVLLLAVLAILAHAEEEEKYTDKYDGIDIKAILANDKLRSRYVNCFLDDGFRSCVTPDAKVMKELFPEAVVTKCRKCTEKQKWTFGVVAEWFHENDPEKWKQIISKAVKDAMEKGILRRAANKP